MLTVAERVYVDLCPGEWMVRADGTEIAFFKEVPRVPVRLCKRWNSNAFISLQI